MTRVLGVDSKNDIFLDKTGRLAVKQNIDAVLQACEHAMKSQLGEMVLATNVGIPNFDVIWNGSPNLGQYEASARKAILSVSGVIRVLDFNVSVSSNKLSYTTTIETIYGTGEVNA